METLSKWGHEVKVASDWQTVIELLAVETPGILIASEKLPGIEGLDLCRKIRSLESRSYVYIIMTTDYPSQDNMFSALESGADDILGKPFTITGLRAVIRAAERIHNLEKQLNIRIAKLEESNHLIAKTNEQMKRDIFAVAKIQSSLLPSALPLIPQIEFAWSYKPRDELAGDCLNVFRLDEENTAFYVLDVSGRGTAAALLSVSLSRMISPFPSQSTLLKQLQCQAPGYRISSPSEVLSELNRSFPLDVETQQYFTIFFGILNNRTWELKYSIAGHPRPIVLRGNRNIQLEGGGYPIGFVDDACFDENSIHLEKGDRVFIFSDGMSEAINPDGDLFGRKALSENILRTVTMQPKESLRFLLEQGEKWCGPAGLHDDVSLMVFEIK